MSASISHVPSTETCPGCGTTSNNHPSYCPFMDDDRSSCPRGCPADECYCAEPSHAEIRGECAGCGGEFGECYCGED